MVDCQTLVHPEMAVSNLDRNILFSFCLQICLVHYGYFWETLSQNWGKIFHSYGCIFIPFLKILALKAEISVCHLPDLEIFEIEATLYLQALDLKLEFWTRISKTCRSVLTAITSHEFKSLNGKNYQCALCNLCMVTISNLITICL